MISKQAAWGLGGLVMLAAAPGCSGKIHNVGDSNRGGNSGTGGTASEAGNSDIGGTDTGGVGNTGGHVAASGSAGIGVSCSYAGTASGISGAANPSCFDPLYGNEEYRLGPQNAVLLDVHPFLDGPVRNYADQVMLQGQPILETYANFPGATAEQAQTAYQLPDDFSKVADFVGQLYLTRGLCNETSAAGQTITVNLWWKASAAVAPLPTHGIALGYHLKSVKKNLYFADASKSFVIGDPEAGRALNTSHRITLQHTFGENELVDADQIVLGLWVIGEGELATTLYFADIQWSKP